MNLFLLLLAMAVAYAAAYNRSRPPALLLASLLLALSVLSLVLPKLMLTRLTLRRSTSRVAQVGETLEVDVRVHNAGWLPRMMVEVEDSWSRRVTGEPEVGSLQPAAARIPLGVLAWLGSRSEKRFVARVPCSRRGLWSLGPARLVCAYPLGLVQASREEKNAAQSLVVYPRLFEVTKLPLAGSVLELNRDERPVRHPLGVDEFLGLREYRPGDPLKHIAWHASARHRELLVKEFEPAAGARLCVALDLNARTDVGATDWTTSEAAISIAASVGRWAARTQLPLRVCATSEEPAPPAALDGELGTPETTDPLLTWFATVSTRRSLPYADVLMDVAATTHPGETVLAFVGVDETDWPAVLGALLEVQQAGAEVRVVVLDRQAFLREEGAADSAGEDARGRCAALEAWGMRALRVGPETELEALFR